MDRPRDRSMYGETRMKVVERPMTVNIQPRSDAQQISPDEILKYLESSMGIERMEKDLMGVQRLFEGRFEVTFRTEEEKDRFIQENDPLVINDKHMFISKPRQREVQVFQQFTPVFVSDYPMEEDNTYLFQKLGKYGEVVNVTDLHYKGTNIRNGTRMARYKEIRQPIPTSMYCRNMRVRMRHDGQDRIPRCSICKEKGHWYGVCHMNDKPWPQEITTELQPDLPSMNETAKESTEGRKEVDIVSYDDIMEGTNENPEEDWKLKTGKKKLKKRKSEEVEKEGIDEGEKERRRQEDRDTHDTHEEEEKEGEREEQKQRVKAQIKKKRLNSPKKNEEREEEDMQEEKKTEEEVEEEEGIKEKKAEEKKEEAERKQKRKEKKKERRIKEKEEREKELDLKDTQRKLFGDVSDSEESEEEEEDEEEEEKMNEIKEAEDGEEGNTETEGAEGGDILQEQEWTDSQREQEIAHRERAGNFYANMTDSDIFGTPLNVSYTQQRTMEDLESQGDITEEQQREMEDT